MSNINSSSQNLYSIPEVQEPSTLDPLFEEISDDKSASLTGGATKNFRGRVPSFGSKTFSTEYTTTTQFEDISIRMSENPYDLYVKAVRPAGGGDLSGYTKINANSSGLITVANDVPNGTRFQLNFNAPTANYFDIVGRISY